MNKEDFQKLIGGYATGSLTDEERVKLFEAALEDQELFDALQQEQALKDLFDDPFSREQVRRAAAESLPQPKEPRRTSWFRQPWVWASATSLAMAGVLVVALVRWDRTASTPPQKQVAQTSQQPAGEQPATPPAVEAPKPGADKPAVRDEGRLLARRAHGSAAPPPAQPAPALSEPRPSPSLSAPPVSDPRPTPPPSEPRPPARAGSGSGPKESRSTDQLAQNRESDLRDSTARPNQLKAPETSRKDEQAAAPSPPPPPPARPAIAQTRQQFGGSGLRQSPQQVEVQSQSPAIAQEKVQAMAATTTQTTNEMKSGRAAPAKAKGAGSGGLVMRKAAAPQTPFYSLARKEEDGSFVTVPSDTVFKTGDVVRVTITPRVTGPLSIWEADASNPEWRRLFPPSDSKKTNVQTEERSLVPVDVVVQKDQRVRVMSGSEVTYISILTAASVAK